jgi:GTPase SAR1 family protein
LLVLFLVQFPLTDTTGRLVLAGIYLVLAAVGLIWHHHAIIPTLLAPWRPTPTETAGGAGTGSGPMNSQTNLADQPGVSRTSTRRHRPDTTAQRVTPWGSQDLRGQPVTQLHYPRNSIVVLAGIPGAGKSTLLHRLFNTTGAETQPIHHPDGAVVLDSEQARNHLRRRLWWLPYPLWRPLAHLLQYARIRAALRAGCPLVVHDCGTRFWVPRLLHSATVGRDLELHLILLNVDPEVARAAQHERHRLVRAAAFAAHCRRWQTRTATDPAGLIPDATSAVVLDRATAEQIQAIHLQLRRETTRSHNRPE